MSVHWVHLTISFRIPGKEPPKRASTKRDSPFPEPCSYLKIPSQRTLQVPQRAPTEGETRLWSFLIHLSLKVWVPSGSLWREKLRLQSQLFILSFISVRVPNKEPSHEKRGKHLVTVHRATSGRKAYIKWGVAWFPKGIFYDIAISTPVPCSLQLDTFHLGLGRPEPR